MIYKFVNFPIFIEIGSELVGSIEEISHSNNFHFNNPLVLTGQNSGRIVEKMGLNRKYKVYPVGSIGFDTINEIRRILISKNIDTIIAIGGGRIIDMGKYLSKETLLPLISVPTLLSNDGISSPISILRIDGKYKSIGSSMPVGIIVDVEIIKSAPSKYLLAGIGDLISNLSASYDWELAHKEIGERIDNFSKSLAYIPALSILRGFRKFGNIYDDEFIRELAEGLVLSGISMNIAHSSRPASGSEHNIGHALDRILGFGKVPHGIEVGFATLLTLKLQGQEDIYRELEEMYKRFGFPTTCVEAGIDCQDFIEALKLAPTIRDRYTILNKYSTGKIIELARDVYSRGR